MALSNYAKSRHGYDEGQIVNGIKIREICKRRNPFGNHDKVSVN